MFVVNTYAYTVCNGKHHHTYDRYYVNYEWDPKT